MEKIHDIYDRIAKRCISLSDKCTINLINGLYGTKYPVDSTVTYNWTEHEDDALKRTLADTIVTINGTCSYHIEFQMTKDGDIILRMLEYGFHHAMNTRGIDTIYFPEPLIVYLYNREKVSDEYALTIVFGSQGEFIYKVPVYKYLEKSLKELDDKKLIVLIPFQLLRLRQAIEKERTPENIDALKKLITHDILDTLNRNENAGNITRIEAMKLRRMILHLYHHIYMKYEELEREGVNQMAEEALIFDVDILEHKINKLEREMEALEKRGQELEKTGEELQEKNQNLKAENQNLELVNRDLQTANEDLQSTNQNLELANRDLQSANQNLEAAKKNLVAEMQVWKLQARGTSIEEIALKTGLSLEAVQIIVESE